MRANGAKVKPQVRGRRLGLRRRRLARREDADLPPRPGPLGEAARPAKARKLSQLPDNSKTTSVFSSDGKRVAAFVAVEDQQQLVSINVKTGAVTELAAGYDYEEGEGTVLGPVIDWQPVARRHSPRPGGQQARTREPE